MPSSPFPANAVPSQPGSSSPKVIYEEIMWLDYWVYGADRNDLPRVLLIGDSISHHYRDPISEAFKGRAYISRLGSSAIVCLPSFMDEVRYALGQHTYDVIHFNNGLHGFEYTEEEYAHGLAALVKFLKADASGAKLVWASSTPWRKALPDHDKFDPHNERVEARNKLAADLMALEKIPTHDLYALMLPHPELSLDGIHYKTEGTALMIPQIVEAITPLLPQTKT